MTLPPDTRQSAQYLSITTAAGVQALQLDWMRGTEQLSRVYGYELELSANTASLNWQSLIGTAATIAINGSGQSGDTRYISGVFSSFALAGATKGKTRTSFRATLVPRVALLDLAQDCCIYQNQTTIDIVKAVLSAAGIAEITTRLTGTYTAREYCVQWRETHLNFISRLLEDEGMYYWFEHSSSLETLIISDNSDKHDPTPVVPALSWTMVDGRMSQDATVVDCGLALRVVTESVGLNAWSFLTPSTSLYATQQNNTSGKTITDWGNTHTDSTAGARLAGIRLAAYGNDAKVMTLRGPNRYVCCGYSFSFSGHPDTALNASWVASDVTIEATPDEFTCDMRALPAATTFRPPRLAHRPTIASTQTAIVVGPSGEEISTDQYGRVKVQFHWDRLGKSDENSSCWIRVAQGWAGAGWGSMFIPRIGNEVVVSFLDGNPDTPLITGAVYNATKTVPYPLPANQTKSTMHSLSSPNGAGKYNEIRFEDKAGSEEVFIQAQKDLTLNVLNNATTTITKDDTLTVNGTQTVTVKSDQSFEVQEGNETYKITKGTRTMTVAGNETHTNSADFTQTVKGDYKLSVTGDMTLTVTGSLTIKAASVIMESTSGTVGVTAATAMTLKGGTTLAAQAATALTAKGATVAVTGSSEVNVSGAMVNVKSDATGEISAGAMLTVKGGIVKIN